MSLPISSQNGSIGLGDALDLRAGEAGEFPLDVESYSATGAGDISASISGSGAAFEGAAATGAGTIAPTGAGLAFQQTATGAGDIAPTGAGTAFEGAAATGAGDIAPTGSAAATHVPFVATGAGIIDPTGAGTVGAGAAATGAGVIDPTGSGAADFGGEAIATGAGVIDPTGAAAAQYDVGPMAGAGSITPEGAGTAAHGVTLAGAGAIAPEGAGDADFETLEPEAEGAGTIAAIGGGNVILGDYDSLAGAGVITIAGYRTRASAKRSRHVVPSGTVGAPGEISVTGKGRVSRKRAG